MTDTADLLAEIAQLRALLAGSEARAARLDAHGLRKDERIQRLEKLVAAFRQALFGRRSEKSDPDQYDLALEDIEAAMATVHAEDEDDSAGYKVNGSAARRKARAANRGALPAHLPRIDEVIEPHGMICACGGDLHCIGEDVSERLDVIPAQFRVIVTHRPKYACRACTDGVVQAPAAPHLVPGGLPTEALVAHVLVSKYADHLPLYRQAQIYSRDGVDLDRSTLADWVGRAAFELRPVYEALLAALKRSTKLFMDETRAPVLDPGARKVRNGYFWALARDERPWSGTAPPGVAFTYAPGRGGQYAEQILAGFSGILQVDGYAGYNRLIAQEGSGARPHQNIQLAYCWAHARRKLVEITRTGAAPIAEEGVRRIGELYRIEVDIRSLSAEARLAARQQRSAPLVTGIHEWLVQNRARVSAKSPLGEALKYIARYWDGLRLFLTDGRIELDNNTVERTIRPIALNRKNALFAGHDTGAQNWAMIASLIETCKLNAVNPHTWLAATLGAIVKGHKQADIDSLLPWSHQRKV